MKGGGEGGGEGGGGDGSYSSDVDLHSQLATPDASHKIGDVASELYCHEILPVVRLEQPGG